MDAVWLILDSLGFDATPFGSDQDTLPEFSRLADERGIVYTHAYTPGPFSPSAHASFFTGHLPSTTGMYEAHPRFDDDVPTIGEVMSETHSTHLTSTNMFLFQGLDRGFDTTNDFSREYMMFRDASDPLDYSPKYNDDPRWKRYIDLVLREGKPFRSLANGLSYKLGSDRLFPKRWGDDENFQYVTRLNDEVERVLDAGSDDSFVVVNYMDLHAPFDISEAAMDKFFPNREKSDLPVGVPSERDKLADAKSYDPDLLYELYRAAIWDFDRKFTPFLERLVDDGTFVAIFGDHGQYDTNSAYSDERLNVPLILFDPDEEPRRVPHTVNLRDLPRTTARRTQDRENDLPGESLLDVEDDRNSVTEVIHSPNEVYERTRRIYVNRPSDGADPEDIQHDCVLVSGDTKVTLVDGEFTTERGSEDVAASLRELGQEITDNSVVATEDTSSVDDEVTEERLRRLGYIEQ